MRDNWTTGKLRAFDDQLKKSDKSKLTRDYTVAEIQKLAEAHGRLKKNLEDTDRVAREKHTCVQAGVLASLETRVNNNTQAAKTMYRWAAAFFTTLLLATAGYGVSVVSYVNNLALGIRENTVELRNARKDIARVELRVEQIQVQQQSSSTETMAETEVSKVYASK